MDRQAPSRIGRFAQHVTRPDCSQLRDSSRSRARSRRFLVSAHYIALSEEGELITVRSGSFEDTAIRELPSACNIRKLHCLYIVYIPYSQVPAHICWYEAEWHLYWIARDHVRLKLYPVQWQFPGTTTASTSRWEHSSVGSQSLGSGFSNEAASPVEPSATFHPQRRAHRSASPGPRIEMRCTSKCRSHLDQA